MLGLYLPAFLLAFSSGLVVPALPILVKTSFDIPFSTASLAITAAVVGSATATLPVGRLLDSLDRKLVAAFGPALVAIASVLVPRSTSFAELLLWQFIAGWGSQTWMLGRLAVLGDLATRDRLGRQMTTMIGFEAAGRLVGPAVGGALVAWFGVGCPFLVQGAVCGLLASMLLWTRRHLKAVTLPPSGAAPIGVRALLKDHGLGHLLPIQALVALTRGALLAGVVDLYMVYHYNLQAGPLGLLRSSTMLACLPITFAAGVVMDRFGRRWTLIPGFVVISLSFLTMSAVAMMNLPLQYFAGAYVIVYMSTYFTGGAMQTLGIDAAPPAYRGRYLGILRLAADSGSAASCGIFAAVAAATGYASAFLALALCGSVATGAIAKYVTEPRRD